MRRSTIVAVMAALAGVVVAAPSPSASATAPTLAPALAQPADGSPWTPDTALRWGAVTGAAKYEVQIATDDTFGAVVYSQVTAARVATPSKAMPEGTLYWHVRALDAAGSPGPASSTWTLVKGPADVPVPLTPEDGETKTFPGEPPVFTWTAVDGAKSYQLEID